MSARTTVGGKLDMSNLALLHFMTLNRSAQAAAIRRLAATGLKEHDIASATNLSVVFIRRVLSEVQA